ncbi:metal-dependent hydrolase [Xanthomonas sp. SI]|uniref:metal-dependent hydrolase n=1 Tax=Xanthomonas sp. SI TaxID=2724123 RepID=UPI0016399F70|nr:metal-dependent hydrolase [Xanthomonas sp. SI]QNH14029.1 metal-dependent hydrolase [Xanthomonas sp. SI]
MPSIFTHAAIPLALWAAADRGRISTRLLGAGIVASMLPDLDVVAFALHIPYADAFGHRGASHSLLFAAVLGVLGALQAATWMFVCTVSHPLLDALTSGGLGVALAWPWSEQRWFAPWRPIRVSPFANGFFGARGMATLLSELRWVWLPLAMAVGTWKLLQPPPSSASRSQP